MFKCDRCRNIKEELSVVKETHNLDYGYEELDDTTCSCGGEYYETEQCIYCDGDFFEEELENGLCQQCYDEILDPEQMINYIEDNDLHGEFFVNWWIGVDTDEPPTRLITLCRNDWEEEYDITSRHNIALSELIEFIKDDIEDYVKWVNQEELVDFPPERQELEPITLGSEYDPFKEV